MKIKKENLDYMPTSKRKWYSGANYHVTARGNNKNNIFKNKSDFSHYLTLLVEALKYYEYDEYKIICYCLMDNHVHILIKTEEKAPGQFIGRIHSKYTKYYNKKYNCIGHLFQDRYYSEIIKNDSQMIETSRYIHLNPVRANMVKKAEEYRWSSYSMYIGDSEEEIISSDNVLYYFQEENKREIYKKFVESVISDAAVVD